ncbi:Heat-inducible transcription repressor HrcA [subsurface metagenome]
MLSARTGAVLNNIVGQYISGAVPVPSQSVANEFGLKVSPATIRNEMAHLEQEGYITRCHPSAGSTPSDKGYRYYVESLSEITLPLAEQRLISHLFHQVERKLEEWLSLSATLIAQLAQNMAVVTMPKPAGCQFKHVEVIALQGPLALVILVLRGAKVKEELITFDQTISQSELTASTSKLNAAYSGLTSSQILAEGIRLSSIEQQVTDCLVKIMQAEDEQEYEEPYLNGWHFMLNQPEFAYSHRMLTLIELIERRELLKSIIPEGLSSQEVKVVIGKENKAEAIHNCSVVISQYGLPQEAMGTIGVIGPTRMPYAHAISAISYLASLMTRLVAELYGQDTN